MSSRVAGAATAVDAPQRSGRAAARRRIQRGSAWLIPASVTLLAGALRFHRLDVPARRYFDEVHYVEDAVALLADGVGEGFVVHPPLGKWLMGAGIAVFGDTPFGWRAAVALAGTATVLVVYLAAMRLLRHRGIAALAALLVAVDGLALAMSRIAMLDGFVALGVATAFWLLLVDRDHMWSATSAATPDPADDPAPRPPPRPRRARWLSAAVLGATVAVKWSGVLALGAAALFVVVSELAWRRRTTGRALAGWARLAGHLALAFVALPAAVYVVSYAGWFAGYAETRPAQERCGATERCEVALTGQAADWAREQAEIWRFHVDLDTDHPYSSSAWGWPVLQRPVTHAFEHCTPERQAELADEDRSCPVAEGRISHILGLGNPVTWWLAVPGYLLLAWFALRRRDWRAWAIAGFWLAQYAPWLVQERATLFLFYMTPVVPFIALTVAYAAWRGLAVRRLWWLPALIAVLAVAAFVYWYPVLVGTELTPEAWRQRMWLPGWV